MYNVLLVVHILSVIVWLGAAVGAMYAGSRLVAIGGDIAVAWLRVSERMGPHFYGPASGLTLLSGIGLVLTVDAYGFGSLFVVVGLIAWVLLAIGNGAVAGRWEKQTLATFEDGDEPTGRQTMQKLNRFTSAELIVLTVTVIAMVYRWGV